MNFCEINNFYAPEVTSIVEQKIWSYHVNVMELNVHYLKNIYRRRVSQTYYLFFYQLFNTYYVDRIIDIEGRTRNFMIAIANIYHQILYEES